LANEEKWGQGEKGTRRKGDKEKRRLKPAELEEVAELVEVPSKA